MEESQPRRSRHRKRKRTASSQTLNSLCSDNRSDMMMADAVDVQVRQGYWFSCACIKTCFFAVVMNTCENVLLHIFPQANSTVSIQSIIAYYALLFLKVGMWIVFAWILSHLHLAAPCLLLPLIFWRKSLRVPALFNNFHQ